MAVDFLPSRLVKIVLDRLITKRIIEFFLRRFFIFEINFLTFPVDRLCNILSKILIIRKF